MNEIRKDREIEQLLQETLLLWGEIAEAVSNSSPSHGELRQFCNETMLQVMTGSAGELSGKGETNPTPLSMR